MGVVIAVRRNKKEKEREFELAPNCGLPPHITWGLERGGEREYEAAVVIDFLASLAALYRDVCRGIRPG